MKAKHLIMAAPLTMAITFLSACGDDDNDIKPNPEVPENIYGVYNGKYSCYMEDGSLSMKGESQAARLVKGEDSDTLYMDQIRFAAAMPAALDIRFANIRVQDDQSTLSMTVATTIPEAVIKGAWTPIEAQIISDFEGRAVKDSLYLNFKCGGKWLHYAGKYVR